MLLNAPTLDRALISDTLCPLLSAYLTGPLLQLQPCKVVYQSTTSTYYAVSAPDSAYAQIVGTVRRDNDVFTQQCGLLCGTTITIKLNGDVRVRYRASPRACIAQ